MITSKADLRRWGQLVNVIEFTTSIKMCVKGNTEYSEYLSTYRSGDPFPTPTPFRPPFLP